MIKSGSLLLTNEDLQEYYQGRVSQRLKDSWGLTLEDLQKYIQNNNYEVIDDVRESREINGVSEESTGGSTQ